MEAPSVEGASVYEAWGEGAHYNRVLATAVILVRGAAAGVWRLVTGTPRRASRTDQGIAVLQLRQSPGREVRRAQRRR